MLRGGHTGHPADLCLPGRGQGGSGGVWGVREGGCRALISSAPGSCGEFQEPRWAQCPVPKFLCCRHPSAAGPMPRGAALGPDPWDSLMHQCANTPMCQCTNVPVPQYTSTVVWPCSHRPCPGHFLPPRECSYGTSVRTWISGSLPSLLAPEEGHDRRALNECSRSSPGSPVTPQGLPTDNPVFALAGALTATAALAGTASRSSSQQGSSLLPWGTRPCAWSEHLWHPPG